MRLPHIVIGVVAALALAGGGFAAGMTFEKGRSTTDTGVATTTTPGGRAGAGPGRQGVGGAGGVLGGQVPVVGRVLAVNDGSITVAAVDRAQAAPGATPATTSQIVLVGSSTRIVKTVETDVRLAELRANDQVTIVGTTDAAGIVSASTIVVGPTNILGQLLGSQTGTPGQRPGASAAPTSRP